MADRAGGFSDGLYQAALVRMNYPLELDRQTELNVRNAMEEAQDYLRGEAGNPAISFEGGSYRGLFLDCTWYMINHKRAEFGREYASELTTLRLTEGFGCGKSDETEPV